MCARGAMGFSGLCGKASCASGRLPRDPRQERQAGRERRPPFSAPFPPLPAAFLEARTQARLSVAWNPTAPPLVGGEARLPRWQARGAGPLPPPRERRRNGAQAGKEAPGEGLSPPRRPSLCLAFPWNAPPKLPRRGTPDPRTLARQGISPMLSPAGAHSQIP